MRQKLISAQYYCYCAKPEIVFVPSENETVCKVCGVVLDNETESSFQEIENTIPYEMLCKTNLNLHQRKQIGGDPHDEQKIVSSTKFHTHRESDQNLLMFSDVCRKLSLNSTISEDGWTAFSKDRSNLTKAKKMCRAIYQTLQNMAIPYEEKTVQEIVCSSLSVKSASDQKGIIFKTGFSPAFDSKETKRRFYLNLFVQQAQKEYEIPDVSTLRKNSQVYLDDLMTMFPKSDYRTMAKKATDMAIMRCVTS
ncbi:MAG: TFIIB-type zinc ribbon-containing protein [Nitrosopumilus sp.]|nr:TFIIB-type zinc ribbon-containing protein [Nitrosopumilus sp.]